jgi:hypothetical protein
MSKMVQTFDGRHAIDVDLKSRGFGWVHYWHPSGNWVTLRKSTPHEIAVAKASPQAKDIAAPECGECGHPIDFHATGCTSDRGAE